MSLLASLNAALGDTEKPDETIPYWLATSLPNVNYVLSDDMTKAFPGGRLILISGPSSSGKTALATEAMVQAQRHPEGFATFNDHENAFLLRHAQRQGLDESRFYYRQPLSAEESFELLYDVMQQVRAAQHGVSLDKLGKASDPGFAAKFCAAMKKIDKVKMSPLVQVVDSIAAMIPNEQDVNYENQNMRSKNMSLASLLSTELKRLVRDANHSASTVIMLNQLRTNPSVKFGDKSTEPGGQAPPYYASMRLRLRKVDQVYNIWDDKASGVAGDLVELYVAKNKVARPFRRTKYVFRTSDPVGLDPVATLIVLGKEAGVLGPAGGKSIEFGGKKRWSIDEFTAQARGTPALVGDLIKTVMPAVLPSLTAESEAEVA
mgnify:CR=1 FL=1